MFFNNNNSLYSVDLISYLIFEDKFSLCSSEMVFHLSDISASFYCFFFSRNFFFQDALAQNYSVIIKKRRAFLFYMISMFLNIGKLYENFVIISNHYRLLAFMALTFLIGNFSSR